MTSRESLIELRESQKDLLAKFLGKRIVGVSSVTEEDGHLQVFHLLNEDGEAIRVRASDLVIDSYPGWRVLV